MTLLVSLVVAPAAFAADPLPYSSLTPDDGASFPAGQTGTPFGVELHSGTGLFNLQTEVSTSNLPGVDGSLADDYRVDTFYLFQSDAFPGTYRGNSGYTYPAGGGWEQSPGTYYWQTRADCYQPSCGGDGSTLRTYLGPVRRVVVTAPSTPGTPGSGGQTPTVTKYDLTMTFADARSYIRPMIRGKTNGRITKLRSRCARSSYRSIRCRLSWRIKRVAFSGTARFFHFQKGNTVYWNYVFSGKRLKADCRRGCVRHLHW